jgi:two-component system alkaline phosphatase synthesis response regulator PhoP
MANEKILVIDDEPEVVKALKIRLEKNNYKVITANDGETGLKKAQSELPDLIILDIIMPGMDGYQVLEKIKTGMYTDRIPVIMLTVKSRGDDIEKAFDKRADYYITKPYDFKQLLKKVRELIKENKENIEF